MLKSCFLGGGVPKVPFLLDFRFFALQNGRAIPAIGPCLRLSLPMLCTVSGCCLGTDRIGGFTQVGCTTQRKLISHSTD